MLWATFVLSVPANALTVIVCFYLSSTLCIGADRVLAAALPFPISRLLALGYIVPLAAFYNEHSGGARIHEVGPASREVTPMGWHSPTSKPTYTGSTCPRRTR
jgi:hypothetical protein